MTLTKANLKSRYRSSLLGLVWVALNPILLFSVQSYVFHLVLKINVPNYQLFLLSGLLPWIFLVSTLDQSINVFSNNARFLHTFQMHPLVFLGAQVLDGLFNFLFALLLIVSFLLFNSPEGSWRWLLIPMPVLILTLGVFSLCWLLALLQIFYKDLRFVVNFVMTLCFYLTPIFYPISFIPENLRFIYKINFLYFLIRPFQMLTSSNSTEDFWLSLGYAGAIALTLFAIAALTWRKKRNEFVFHL